MPCVVSLGRIVARGCLGEAHFSARGRRALSLFFLPPSSSLFLHTGKGFSLMSSSSCMPLLQYVHRLFLVYMFVRYLSEDEACAGFSAVAFCSL